MCFYGSPRGKAEHLRNWVATVEPKVLKRTILIPASAACHMHSRWHRNSQLVNTTLRETTKKYKMQAVASSMQSLVSFDRQATTNALCFTPPLLKQG